MALPVDIITLADLNTAYTAEKVMQQLGTKGKNAPDADRVKLVIESAIGFVMGQIQRAVVKSSVYDLWVSRWRDDDRAEIRRRVLTATGDSRTTSWTSTILRPQGRQDVSRLS
jgi:UDP-galactopyranose mutase